MLPKGRAKLDSQNKPDINNDLSSIMIQEEQTGNSEVSSIYRNAIKTSQGDKNWGNATDICIVGEKNSIVDKAENADENNTIVVATQCREQGKKYMFPSLKIGKIIIYWSQHNV